MGLCSLAQERAQVKPEMVAEPRSRGSPGGQSSPGSQDRAPGSSKPHERGGPDRPEAPLRVFSWDPTRACAYGTCAHRRGSQRPGTV